VSAGYAYRVFFLGNLFRGVLFLDVLFLANLRSRNYRPLATSPCLLSTSYRLGVSGVILDKRVWGSLSAGVRAFTSQSGKNARDG
jgi:hypothetical protein